MVRRIKTTIAADDLPEVIWIVTLKYKPDKNHDPHNKKTGKCLLSPICTDKTGAHHCVLVIGKDIEEVTTKVRHHKNGIHITRIEKASVW